ncbi:HAMP domain-containing sensor histidine kinase [Luteibacter sp. PPL201]|uniref:histidine kinase n=1 Tax=Luteibacter sahnii TaxID=3021977 RepID=A0ABT6BD41_9GAMM|nr:HAMP domain-containing sensor histidine kinase [Luteibacter sp. PPL193]MDY1549327.1 HAMP domain-containing sensor histidine kinase [Luteibacter sp. PPL193]
MSGETPDVAAALRRELRARSLHALNSPLGAIMAQAELTQLLVRREAGGAADAATRIVDDGERCARMLRDAFAAMDELDTWQPGRSAVGDTVDDAMHDVGSSTMTVRVTGGDVVLPWCAPMAAAWFRRCLDNAFRHGASVVDVTAQDDAGDTVVSVHDDGEGLRGLTGEGALRPFVSTTPGTHTGLGLWLVQAMARWAGGSVALPSVPAGFTVQCRLPSPGRYLS